jgi:TetR/AcrR family transcriptional regulator
MAIKRRAVKDEQKQQRQKDFIVAAIWLFEQLPYQQITLEAVAEKAGVKRTTLYLYFKTKEELYLTAFEQLFRQWLSNLGDKLTALVTKTDRMVIADFARLITSSLVEQWTTVRLSALSPVILEQYQDISQAVRYKQTLLADSQPLCHLIERSLPFFAPGQGLHFLIRLQILLTGLQPFSNPYPSAFMHQNYADIADPSSKLSFEQEMTALLQDILYGMQYQASLKQ